ncbi:RNA directed RNA polymerase [Ustilaginoidea virens RNA virus M]|uniref:RNA directed RNA polymerase n=1 Tax=Ustilaginoidea virens RNA virus M TaxID=1561172 RepID=UPI00051F81F5|nr:RNA directed RNA polymerase [Ustilaginoidea virens RNA virus M]AIT56395.1 RNA directed RNA polymerase [Ustilaginoidea virens RNA virus M]
MSEYVPPSIEDLWKHLQGFGANPIALRDHITVPVTEMLSELRGLDLGRGRIAGWLEPENILRVEVPAATSPGIRWKKLGYKTKRDAMLQAAVEARGNIVRMRDVGGGYEVPPCGVAGRGKRVPIDRPSDGERKEGRFIVMPDLVRHLMGMIAVQPLMKKIKQADKSNGGVMLGMGPFGGSYDRLAEYASGGKAYLCIDFKKFDQSVPRSVLRAVMQRVREEFDEEEGSDGYWRSEFKQLVDTEVAMPDGHTYAKRAGVSSGDPWTSIVGSVANWLVLRIALKRLGVDARIWTFGDDSLIAVDTDVPSESWLLEAVARELKSVFGMTVSKEKSIATRHLVGVFEEPEVGQTANFLSAYFLQTGTSVVPVRPIQDLHELMLVPERRKDTVWWEVARTAMAYLVFFWNDSARMTLEWYWDFLHREYEIPQLRGDPEILGMLRLMDLPWDQFKEEWLIRLPYRYEVELLYSHGYTTFFPPALWALTYKDHVPLDGGNKVWWELEGQ